MCSIAHTEREGTLLALAMRPCSTRSDTKTFDISSPINFFHPVLSTAVFWLQSISGPLGYSHHRFTTTRHEQRVAGGKEFAVTVPLKVFFLLFTSLYLMPWRKGLFSKLFLRILATWWRKLPGLYSFLLRLYFSLPSKRKEKEQEKNKKSV